MSTTVNYASTPVSNVGTLTTGDTSRTAPTNFVTIFDPSAFSASGGSCQRINIARLGATVQSAIRIFKYDGSAFHLLFEVQLAAASPTGQVADPGLTLQAVNNTDKFPIYVPAGWTLRASVNDTQAAGIVIQGEGGGF